MTAADGQPARRSLDKLLRPASIAIIGASDEPSRIGGRPLAYLLAAGFRGPIYPVNSKRSTVQGLKAYPTIAAVPGSVDFAVIAVTAEQAVETLLSSEDPWLRSCAVCDELVLRLLIDCGFLLAAWRAPGPWHASHCSPPGPNGARLSMRCACLPLKMAAPE